jgi:rhodanese-related sulfurtransferase
MSEDIKELRKNSEEAAKFFAKKLAYTLGPVEVQKMMAKNPNTKLIDLRQRADYDAGHIPEAISIPRDELRKNLGLLSKDDINIVYCYNQQCHLGASACFVLAENAFPCMEMEGGFDVWVNNFHFDIVK